MLIYNVFDHWYWILNIYIINREKFLIYVYNLKLLNCHYINFIIKFKIIQLNEIYYIKGGFLKNIFFFLF